MLKNNLTNNFEQNPSQILPPQAMAIVRSIASDFIRKNRHKDHLTKQKRLGLAHAHLHMRMYQKFGADSQEFMTQAYQLLQSLSESSDETMSAMPTRVRFSV